MPDATALAATITKRGGFRFHSAFVWEAMPIRPQDWVYTVTSGRADGADLVLEVLSEDSSPTMEIRVGEATGALTDEELRIDTATSVIWGDRAWRRSGTTL